MKTLLLSHNVTFRKQSERSFPSKTTSNITSVHSKLTKYPKSPTWYHDLPLEVLLKIFSNFSEKELRKNIIPVCQKWRYAALKPELWKCLEIIGSKVPLNRICYEISRFPYLQTVVLKSVDDPKQIIRQICRCLSNLKELTVKDCEEIPEKTLINVLYSCRHLEKLNLSGTPFRGKKIYENISLLPNLKSLNLAKNPYITVKKLTTCVLNCNGLEEFRLSKWVTLEEILKFDDQDVSPILLNLSSSLRSLTLDCSNLTTNSFNKIFACSSLERISLHRAKHLNGEMFANLYRFFPGLTILKVKHASQISDANIIQLFTEGEVIMENLQTLDLSGCWQLTDNGLRCIINCCKNLSRLSLQSCKSLVSISPLMDTSLNFLNIAFNFNMDVDNIEKLKVKELIIDERQEKKISEKITGVDVWVSRSEYRKCLRKKNVSREK